MVEAAELDAGASNKEDILEQIVLGELGDATETSTETSTEEIMPEEEKKGANAEYVEEKQEVEETEDYKITYKVISCWNTGYNAEIVIANTGKEIIHNWMLEFKLKDNITNIWNGKIYSSDENCYRIKNTGWNGEIKVGEQVSFGYTAEYSGESMNEPEEYNILGIQSVVQENDYEIDCILTDSWQDGYIMELVISNKTNSDIEDWQLQFVLDLEIKNVWNGRLTELGDNTYCVHNAGDNANILAGESVVVGLEIGTKEGQIHYPENILLEKVHYDDESLSEDEKYLNALYEYYGIDKKVEDNDKDGLPDITEMLLLGLDPTRVDTDENGVADGDEDHDEDGLENKNELEFGSDPLDCDSDGDGLLDGEEYYQYGTDILQEDTDDDGLSDYEEIQLGTDPLNPMTDGVNRDSERYFKQTLSNDCISLTDGEEEILVPSLCCEIKGDINSYITITDTGMDMYLSNRAIIGMPIKITNKKDDMRNAVLSFEMRTLLDTLSYDSDSMNELTICKLDGYREEEIEEDEEEVSLYAQTQEKVMQMYGFQPLEATFSKDKQVLSAPIEEDGIYMVINEREFLSGLGINIHALENVEPETISGQADIVFVIDSTGSMGNAIQNTAKNVTDFVEALEKKYNVQSNFSLIEYKDIKVDGDDSTQIHQNGFSNWYTDAERFSEEIHSLLVDGGGDTPESLVDALGMAETLDYRENVDKFIIIITDADYKTENHYGYTSLEEVVGKLNDRGVTTSIITNKTYKNVYKCVTENCEGVFGDISKNFASELEKLTSLIGKSSDEGVWYLMDNYEYIKLNKQYNQLGQQDSDGDGLTDVEELGEMVHMDFAPFVTNLVYRYGDSLSKSEKKQILDEIPLGKFGKKIYKTRSNPLMKDTDMDGIIDTKDNSPKASKQKAIFYHKNASLHSGITDISKTQKAETRYDVSYDLNFSDFFKCSNKTYISRLAKVSSYIAGLAYCKEKTDPVVAADDYYCMKYSKKGKERKITDVLDRHGFKNIKTYNLGSDNHKTKCYIGMATVEYRGSKKQIVAVVVKGTNGTAAEWSSNFNMGKGVKNAIDAHGAWNILTNHKGFDIGASRVFKVVNDYERQYVKKNISTAYWITGHSRGAAIANILSAHLVNDGKQVYAYTFATPNTTTSSEKNAGKYDCIFNTVNERDFVTTVPCTGWGFGRYGRTASLQMNSSMKKQWKGNMKAYYDGKKSVIAYNEMSKGHLKDLVSALEKATPNRASIYDHSSDDQEIKVGKDKVYNKLGGIKTEFMPKIMQNELNAVNGYSITVNKNKAKVEQSPMYFMQLLASTMPCANEKAENKMEASKFVQHNVAKKYEKAKSQLIRTNLFRGISHAHYVDTYVLLSEQAKSKDFK